MLSGISNGISKYRARQKEQAQAKAAAEQRAKDEAAAKAEAEEEKARQDWLKVLNEYNADVESERNKRAENLTGLLTDLGQEQVDVITKILKIYDTTMSSDDKFNLENKNTKEIARALVNAFDRNIRHDVYTRAISYALGAPGNSTEQQLKNKAVTFQIIKDDQCCAQENTNIHKSNSMNCSGCITLLLDKLNIENDMVMILYWAEKQLSDINSKTYERVEEEFENGGPEGPEVKPNEFEALVDKMRKLVEKRKEENAKAEAEEAERKAKTLSEAAAGMTNNMGATDAGGGQKKSKRRNSKKKKTRRNSKKKKTRRINKKGKKTTTRRR